MQRARQIALWFVALPLLMHWGALWFIATVGPISWRGMLFILSYFGVIALLVMIVPLVILYSIVVYQLATVDHSFGPARYLTLGVFIPVPLLAIISTWVIMMLVIN